MARLRRGKEELHASHRALPIAAKVRMVIELQGFTLTLIARRRPLKYYERQWPVGSESVDDAGPAEKLPGRQEESTAEGTEDRRGKKDSLPLCDPLPPLR